MPRSRADGAKCPPGRLAERSVTNSAGDASRAVPYVVLGIALLAVSMAQSSRGWPWRRRSRSPPGESVLRCSSCCLSHSRPRGKRLPIGDPRPSPPAQAPAAVHFATWIASLDHTTIARSVLLVSTSPIWVALFQFLAGRGPPSRLTLAALVLAIAGAAVVAGAGRAEKARPGRCACGRGGRLRWQVISCCRAKRSLHFHSGLISASPTASRVPCFGPRFPY